MRKILTKIVTVLMVAVLSVTTLTACGLITVNTERDMAQVVATVQIDEGVNKDEIKKSEMLAAYMSYGYYYVGYYGYTVSATYQLILDNLVQNRIIIQYARKELASTYNGLVDDSTNATEFEKYLLDNSNGGKKTKIDAKSGDSENLKTFLTEYEIAEAEYNVKVNVNSIIDSYVEEDEEDEEEREDTTYTARATPAAEEDEALLEHELHTDVPSDYDYKVANVTLKASDWETLKTEYPNTYALNLAVFKAYEIDISGADRVKALNKAIKDLKKNGLILESESYKAEDVLKYSYFVNGLRNQYESAIVGKFEDSLIDEVKAKLTADALWEQYIAEYSTQKANYENDYAAYETALEAVSEDVFVVCNPYEGYGYVSNLLIGFTDEQNALLSAYAAKPGVSDADVKAYREELLAKLVAKDQRESWVYSSYGSVSEEENTHTFTFTFEKDYFVSEEGSAAYTALNTFKGTLSGVDSYEDENEDKVLETVYTFDNVAPTAMGFDSFMSNYVTTLTGIENKKFVKGDASSVGKIADYNDTVRNAFDDLLYAFSTDPGCLGQYYGYLYSPVTSATTYVKEFADASAAVVAQGVGAYTIVATDYGYHIILCTAVVDSDPYGPESKEAFISDLENKDSIASKYKEIKYNSVSSTWISKLASNFINGYFGESGKSNDYVKYNEKTYSDLITKEDSSSDNHDHDHGHDHNH